MTGAHAAAIGLESIDIMCTVTYFNATSTVARRIRADRDGLGVAPARVQLRRHVRQHWFG